MRRKQILIVEDNPMNRDLLTQLLEADCDVLEAADGREAMLLAAEKLPDLILMDLQMPVMDGWEATAAIRRHPRTCALPVVAVSARTMDDEVARARRAGVNDFVPLPLDETLLYDVVERHLSQRLRRERMEKI